MEFMEIGQQLDPLLGMDIDKTNSGEKCEQFGEVSVVHNFFSIDIHSLSSILVSKVVMGPLS